MYIITFRDVLGEQALLEWWHGKGGLIDYTNKAALDWWHSQMDKVQYILIEQSPCCVLY